MLGFELPQLREILGEILKDYPGFLKDPAEHLSRVKKVVDALPAGSASTILLHLNGLQNSKVCEQTALNAFIEELK
ncbi:MAG: hypothetical protein LBD73_03680, partial [Deferribacteraceae bacterium]|nr:hypothetical protein [Deferribacteraceae bacterium]